MWASTICSDLHVPVAMLRNFNGSIYVLICPYIYLERNIRLIMKDYNA